MRFFAWSVLFLTALGAVAWMVLRPRDEPLPAGVTGTLVFVSDRDGIDSLYARRLPKGTDRRLTFLNEPVREPAVSPDGRMAAFSMGGRIGVVFLASSDVRFLTLGVDWLDAAPSWRPDGKALVVASRHPGDANADLHLLLALDAGPGQVERRPLTLTAGLDEEAPVFGPDGSYVVYIRQDNVGRIDLVDGRARRITGGFRRMREPRFLPSGRLVALWTLEKQYGLDVMDADGKNRETLSLGSTFYRTLRPSPDGRFFAATYTFDLGFHLAEALRLRPTEEVRLLDAAGRPAAVLARSWRHASHSPDWGR
jgi:Tol biopolymer transport system component